MPAAYDTAVPHRLCGTARLCASGAYGSPVSSGSTPIPSKKIFITYPIGGGNPSTESLHWGMQ